MVLYVPNRPAVYFVIFCDSWNQLDLPILRAELPFSKTHHSSIYPAFPIFTRKPARAP